MEQTLKLGKWGNSNAIRLPKTLLDKIGIAPSDKEVEVTVTSKSLIIKPIKKESPLRKMFDGFDTEAYFKNEPKNKEVDWGEPQGKEMF